MLVHVDCMYAGAELEARDTDGCSALHLACLSGYTGLVSVLLAAGADTGARAGGKGR